MTTDVLLELTVPPVGGTSKASYVIYAGPKERDAIQAEYADHEALLREDVDSWLPGDESVATLLIGVLKLLERLTGNWGLAIILMTIMIRLVLFPLNRRSQTAMARYQAVVKRMQPRIDELKKKHEKEPDKLRRAQAELMQKEGAMPPLGGCLPIFVQLPVFFGLFTAVRTSFDLRQQRFVGWITDLSKPDRLMRLDLDTGLPLIGTIEYLNVLPPLMVALWIGQQMVMPKPSDEQARQMQRMMMFMPLVMGVFLYNYASGLSLYMITQSALGILEIGVIKRVWPVDDTPQPRKQAGFLSRLAEKQQQQMKRMDEMKRQQSATRSQSARTRKRKKNRR
jgi:YidC/Oxa1 family membrane protein insertase